MASIVLAPGGILSLHKTLERLRGLENVTADSTDIVMCSKWVKISI